MLPNMPAIQAFQVLSEYLQLLDSFSELSVIQEMSRGVEVSYVNDIEPYSCKYLYIPSHENLLKSIITDV